VCVCVLLYILYMDGSLLFFVILSDNCHLYLPATSPPRVCRDSSVGVATRYGPDGPGIESRWGAKFSATVQTGSEVHPASYTMGTGLSQGVKRPGRGVDHPPPT